ncbi:hypothetical protein V6U90_13830 [Micromonospora sp. CPCC 206060]|uniref:hypothetical protein n=1 Tax=Micromonospora sp. CPCC 206060 TaxID=3122406 RepID=UPI002FF34B99
MSVRGGAVRFAAGAALVAGLLATGAAPALAEGDSVRVRAASSFTAGGSPGAVNLGVTKKTDGCVLVRTGLALQLPGVTARQVRVEVALAGQWRAIPVSGTGTLTTARTAPTNPTLCKGKSLSVRYRVTFLAGAPSGRLNIIGQAIAGTGRTIGYGATTSKVAGGRAVPTPTPSRKPSPSPTPSVTAEATPTVAAAGPTNESSPAAAEVPAAAQASTTSGGGFGIGTFVMIFGAVMVAIGVALLVFLLRRSRAERHPGAGAGAGVPAGAGNPGGTTYRAGTVLPSAGPPPHAGTGTGTGTGTGDATAVLPRLPN